MPKQGKQLLTWLMILSMVLSLFSMSVFALETETDAQPVQEIHAITATATGTDLPVVTITTADRFPIMDGQAKVVCTVSGLPDGDWYAHVTVGNTTEQYNISTNGDSRYFTYPVSSTTAGTVKMSVQFGPYTITDDSIVYQPVELSVALVDSSKLVPDQALISPAGTKVFSGDVKQNYAHVLLPDALYSSVNPGDLTAKLVGQDGQVYATTSTCNTPNSDSTTWTDSRYTQLLPGANTSDLPKWPCKRVNFTLYQTQPVPEGSYDLVIDGAGSTPLTFPGYVRFTDKPLVNLSAYYSNSHPLDNVVGGTYAYVSAAIYGGDPTDFQVAVYDGDVCLGVSDQWAVDSYYPESGRNYVYRVPLSQAMENRNYEMRVISQADYELSPDSNTSLYVSPAPQASFFRFSSHYYADVVGTVAVPAAYQDTSFKLELLESGQVVDTRIVQPTADGRLHASFQITTGEPYPLQPNRQYGIQVYYLDDSRSNPWSSCYNSTIYNSFVSKPGSSSGGSSATVEVYSAHNAYFQNGNMEGYFVVGSESQLYAKLTEQNGFSFQVFSPADLMTPVVTVDASCKTYSYKNGTVSFTVTAPMPEDLPEGYYMGLLLYQGEALLNPGTQKPILGELTAFYPSYYGPGADISYSMSNINTLQPYTCFYLYGAAGGEKLEVRLYTMDNATMTPDATLTWTTVAGQEAYNITAEQLTNVDLSRQYRYDIWLNGKPLEAYNNYNYFLPYGQQTGAICTVTAEETQHGTLKIMPTVTDNDGNILRYSEVYLHAVPEDGYQLKPGSVRVNGKAIDGLGFLAVGDCVVTAEFEPAQDITYSIEPPTNVTNGTAEVSAIRAAAGETVYVTATPDAGYKVYRLYYLPKAGGSQVDLEKTDDGRYCFTMPEGGVRLYCTFTTLSDYYLSVSRNMNAGGSFTVSANGSSFTDTSGNIREGSACTLTVTVNSGYLLTGVTYTDEQGNKVDLTAEEGSNTYRFTMPGHSFSINITYTKRQAHTISNESSAYLTVPGSAYTGDTVAVTVASLAENTYLSRVYYTLNGTQVDIFRDDTGAYTFVMPDGNVTVSCDVMGKGQVTSATSENGAVMAEKTYYAPGERVVVTVSPAAGYVLGSLQYYSYTAMASTSITQGEDGVYAFTMPNGNVQLQASFQRMVVNAPGGEVYDYATLTAALGGGNNVQLLYQAATGDTAADTTTVTGLMLLNETRLRTPIVVTGGDLCLISNSTLRTDGNCVIHVTGGNLTISGGVYYGGNADGVGSAVVVSGSGSLRVTEGVLSAGLLVDNTTGQVSISGGTFEALDTTGSVGLRVVGTPNVSLTGGEWKANGAGFSFLLPNGTTLSDLIREDGVEVMIDNVTATGEALAISSTQKHVRITQSKTITLAADVSNATILAPGKAMEGQFVTVNVRPADGYMTQRVWYTEDETGVSMEINWIAGGGYQFMMPNGNVTLHATVTPMANTPTQLLQNSVFSTHNNRFWSAFTSTVNTSDLQNTYGCFQRVVLKDTAGKTVAVQEFNFTYSFQMMNPGLPAGQYQLFLTVGNQQITRPLGWQWITLTDDISYSGSISRYDLTPYSKSFTVNTYLEFPTNALPGDLTLEIVSDATGQVVHSTRNYTIRQYAKTASGSATSGNKDAGVDQTSNLRFQVDLASGLPVGSYTLRLTSASAVLRPSDSPISFSVNDNIIIRNGTYDPDSCSWTADVEGLQAGDYQLYRPVWVNNVMTKVYHTMTVDADGKAVIEFGTWPVEETYLHLYRDTNDFMVSIQIDSNQQSSTTRDTVLNDTVGDNWIAISGETAVLSGRVEGASGPGTYEITANNSGTTIKGDIAELSGFSIVIDASVWNQNCNMRILQNGTQISWAYFQMVSRPALSKVYGAETNDVLQFQPINLTADQLKTLEITYLSYAGETALPVQILSNGQVAVDLSGMPYGQYTFRATCEIYDEYCGKLFREPLYLGNNDTLFREQASGGVQVKPLEVVTDADGVTTAAVTYTGTPTGNVMLRAYRLLRPATDTDSSMYFDKTPFFTKNIGTGAYTISSEDLMETGEMLFIFSLADGTCIGRQVVTFGKASDFTVTFVDYDGTVLSQQTVKLGETAVAPKVNQREGYEFTGWKGNFTSVTRNTAVYATYRKTEVTVSFHLNGGIGTVSPVSVKTGSVLNSPIAQPTRDGYVFLGWTTSPTGTKLWDFDTNTVQSDMMLYACWQLGVTVAEDSRDTLFCDVTSAAEGSKVSFKCAVPNGKQVEKFVLARADGITQYLDASATSFTMPGVSVTLSVVYREVSSLSVTLSNGDEGQNYRFYLTGMGGGWSQYGSSASFTGLVSGTYDLSVTCDRFWMSRRVEVSGQSQVTLEVPALYALSGTLTGAGDPDSCYVYAFDEHSNLTAWADVNQDGSYQMGGLAAGTYHLMVKSGDRSPAIAEGGTVTIGSESVTGHTIALQASADLQVTLSTNAQIPGSRVYVNVYDPNSWCIAQLVGSAADGTDLYQPMLITQPGKYTVRLTTLLSTNGTGVKFSGGTVSFTVTQENIDNNQVKITLPYGVETTSAIEALNSTQNLVAFTQSDSYPGSVVDLVIRYRNSNSESLEATFTPQLPDGVTLYGNDPKTAFTRTIQPGETGSITVPVQLGTSLSGVVEVPVTVQVGEASGAFGTAVLSVSQLTITAPAQAREKDTITVSGEAAPGTLVAIWNETTGQLLTTVRPAGRFYSTQITLDQTARLVAQTDSVRSDPVTVEVVQDPLTLTGVYYDNSPASYNSKLDTYAFWRYVDMELLGSALDLEVRFTRSDVTAVRFHFCGQDFDGYAAGKGWGVRFEHWGGSGLKPITADVTLSNGSTYTLFIAYVNLLIDPSGIVTDTNGNPLEGVTVTCLVLDGNVWVPWDAESNGQVNPVVTGADGKYGWFVPEGSYRILAEKDGYVAYDSLNDPKFSMDGVSTIVIPPARTDVDFGMEPMTLAIYPNVSPEGTVLVSDSAKPGETVKVTIAAADGYHADGVIVRTLQGDTVEVEQVGDDYTFTMPGDAVRVYGVFTSTALPTVADLQVNGDQIRVDLKNLNEKAQMVVAVYNGLKMSGTASVLVSGSGIQTVGIPGAAQATEIRVFLLSPATLEPIGGKFVYPAA